MGKGTQVRIVAVAQQRLNYERHQQEPSQAKAGQGPTRGTTVLPHHHQA